MPTSMDNCRFGTQEAYEASVSGVYFGNFRLLSIQVTKHNDSFPGMSENSSFASSCPPCERLPVRKEINYSFIHSFIIMVRGINYMH